MSQSVQFACPCGKTHRFTVEHYDRVIVQCGRPWWALQPKRNGPLVMFPWPGRNLTREEMGGKPSAETIVRRMNDELCGSAGRAKASASGEAQCAPSDSQQ
jgi:hypothetical protein